MFRSFSTRKEKESQKKIPIVKETTNEPQLIKSFELVTGTEDHINQLYKMVINPTFYNSFYKEHFTYSSGNNQSSINFDFTNTESTIISEFLGVISNAVPNSSGYYGNIKIEFEKLTWFTTSGILDIYFTNSNRTSYIKITVPDGSNSIVKTFKVSFINENISTVDELQIIKATVGNTTDFSTIKVTPVAWSISNNNINFNDMVTKIITLYGNYKKLKLTNFKFEEQNEVSGNMETNLVVKNTMTGIIEKMSLPIIVENSFLRWQITSINDIVDTGIPVSEGSEETVKIGINNVGIADNANDSYIDFTQIELTEEQMTRTYWENFYVNKITRYSDQVFDFIFQGYRNTELEYATEEVINKIADVKDVEIKDIGYYTVLILTFEEGAPGFLGKTQRVKLPGLTEPQETVVIYLNEEMSAKVNNEVTKIKFVVEDMKAIVPGTNEDSVNLNLNFYTDRTPEGPTYVAVYHLNQYGTYSASALPISYFDQEITKLNTIYGTVNKNNGKKLIVPLDVDVDNVWSENKLNLKEIVTSGTNLTINETKTTNCLATNAKLNLVVQGAIPIDWYDWLPLNEVYVDDDKKVIINPTDPGDYSSFTKIVSVNALPSDDIGIESRFQSSIDLSTVDL